MFAHLALIHVLQLASKAGASLSGELLGKGHPCFTAVMRSADIRTRSFSSDHLFLSKYPVGFY